MESPTALISHDHFIREVQVYYRKTNSRHFQVTCEKDEVLTVSGTGHSLIPGGE